MAGALFGATALAGCGESGALELPPPPEGGGFQFVEEDFVVEPGQDVVHCERFKAPSRYDGAPVYVTGFESTLPLGTHHFFMAYTTEAGVEEGPCVGDRGEPFETHASSAAKFIFGSGEGLYSVRLPDGYGFYAGADGMFETNHHVLNISPRRLNMGGAFNILTADEADVDHPLRSFACDNRGINVPAHSTGSATATCVAPFDMDLVIAGSHAHQFLTKFEARFFDGETADEEPFYISTDWDSPAITPLAEPLRLNEGQGITFTCHYNNTTDEPLTYGIGHTGEMCASINVYAYPADRPNELPPTLGSVAQDGGFLCAVGQGTCCEQGGVCTLIDTTTIGGFF